MKFFSIVLSLCLHLIVILLLVHFTCVSQKHVSKEEKLYKVNLVSLQEKKVRKVAYVKRKPTKKTKSIPKKAIKKKEIVAKPVPEKKVEEEKKVALPEKAKKEMYSESVEETINKRLKGRIAAMKGKFEEEEKEMEQEKERKKEKEQEKIENEQKRQEEYGSYKELLKTSITKNCFLNEALIEKGLEIIVKITISNNGDIIEAVIKKPSGNKYFDKITMDAINRSDPLPDVPMNLRTNHCFNIELTFNPEKYEEPHN